MASFMKEFDHLEIQLEDIKLATNNFDESKVIGTGGFGKVYAGELSHSQSGEKSLVAIKRLDRRYGQGDPEFWKEIMMLSRYTHENLISLLGFCNKEGEMILVYEHASRGSLDRYLKDATLTWKQRLKICLDAAKGLSYLHDPNERMQRVLHCDIKSANILLDENLNAKVSDFGLSKMGSTGQQYSVIITNAVGTPGYCDPLYIETYQLTKESDVYSFGVVLFEVMCGKQCLENINGQLKVHVPFWKKSYEEKKLDAIVFQGLMQQMAPDSLEAFANIAYKCLQKSREQRPTMSLVVKQLNIALELQEDEEDQHKIGKLPKKYNKIIKAAVNPLIFTSLEELKALLSKGVILNGGKTWFAINEKGEHFERIYTQACLDRAKARYLQHSVDIVNSRFPAGRCYQYKREFKACVRGEYLTSQISYTLNIVFRYYNESQVNSYNYPLRYKIDGEDETKVFIIYPCTHMREDGWFVAPLYHFTSQYTTTDLQIMFEPHGTLLLVVAFEFQPSEEKAELNDPVFEEYQDIVKDASQSLVYGSLEELKRILSKGVHLNGYKTWFSHNKKGEHCHMISLKECLIPNEDSTPQYKSHCCSRFPAGLYQTTDKGFKTHVKAQLLSPKITYTVNLVYNSSSDGNQVYVDLKYRLRGEITTYTVYLANRRDEDMCYMAELYQFTSDGSIVDLEIIFENSGANIVGVEGIMFQPLEIVEDQVSKDEKVENIQTTSDSESDTYWEQKFPDKYEEILNLSKDSLRWTTKKELYSIFRRGFLINNGEQWFSVDKHGKKCLMLSARATWVIDEKNSACESSHESRFGEVLVITAGYKFELVNEIKREVLSADTTYASYFVYKLPSDQSKFECPLEVSEKWGQYYYEHRYIYLVSPPNTPVIGEKFDENNYNPLNRHKLSALPRQRSDGWMEVKVWQFDTMEVKLGGIRLQSIPAIISIHLKLDLKLEHPVKKHLSGLIIHGIELRPI